MKEHAEQFVNWVVIYSDTECPIDRTVQILGEFDDGIIIDADISIDELGWFLRNSNKFEVA